MAVTPQEYTHLYSLSYSFKQLQMTFPCRPNDQTDGAYGSYSYKSTGVNIDEDEDPSSSPDDGCK